MIDTYPREEAERLYKQFSDHGAPVSPLDLAKALGISVWFSGMGSLKGFYAVVNEQPYIAVNSDMSNQLTNAVCAHELGHHILHRDIAKNRLLSDYGLYLKGSRLETEANIFACYLLIPDQLLCKLFDGELPKSSTYQSSASSAHTACPACTIAALAARAGVPYELMALRLHFAGFPAEVPPSAFMAGLLE